MSMESAQSTVRQAKHLISRCLQKDTKQRITAAGALNHEWFFSRESSPGLHSQLLKNLKSFCAPQLIQPQGKRLPPFSVGFKPPWLMIPGSPPTDAFCGSAPTITCLRRAHHEPSAFRKYLPIFWGELTDPGVKRVNAIMVLFLIRFLFQVF